MSSHAGHAEVVAHQFDDAEQQYESATLGMWAFLITEVMFFGGLFTGYTVYRNAYPEAFIEGSHHLDVLLGGINTAILIGSSLTMALAVRAAQMGKKQGIALFLVLTMLLGGAFLGIKVIEYSHKWHERLVPGPYFHLEHTETGADPNNVQLYFSFYFAMTGMHALHMVIGIVIMAVLLAMALRGRFTAEWNSPIEMFGLYWHFVDIVWIFLYPLLYLLGRH